MCIDEIGDRIRQRRKKLGLTQHDLATRLNVSPQAVSKWERGKNAPDIMLIPMLAAILDLTTDQLLGYSAHSQRIQLGSIFAARLRTFPNELGPVDLEYFTISINAFCFSMTEHVKKNGGFPVSYMNEHLLCVFIGERYKERSVRAAVEGIRHASYDGPVSIGLSSGSFFMGPIGHPDYARISVVGDPVSRSLHASLWAERSTESSLAVTGEYVHLPEISGKIRGPESCGIDGCCVSFFEVRIPERKPAVERQPEPVFM